MYHLLPEQNKKELAHDYGFRRATVGLFLFAGALGIIFTATLPTYLIIRAKRMAAESRLGTTGTPAADAELALRADIRRVREEVTALAPDTKAGAGEVLERLLRDRPAGVSLRGFFYSATDGKLLISGTAARRDNAVAFKKFLEGTGFFASVDLPLSNLAKERNIDFSIATVLISSSHDQ